MCFASRFTGSFFFRLQGIPYADISKYFDLQDTALRISCLRGFGRFEKHVLFSFRYLEARVLKSTSFYEKYAVL
jgi:hypothetical protein